MPLRKKQGKPVTNYAEAKRVKRFEEWDKMTRGRRRGGPPGEGGDDDDEDEDDDDDMEADFAGDDGQMSGSAQPGRGAPMPRHESHRGEGASEMEALARAAAEATQRSAGPETFLQPLGVDARFGAPAPAALPSQDPVVNRIWASARDPGSLAQAVAAEASYTSRSSLVGGGGGGAMPGGHGGGGSLLIHRDIVSRLRADIDAQRHALEQRRAALAEREQTLHRALAAAGQQVPTPAVPHSTPPSTAGAPTSSAPAAPYGPASGLAATSSGPHAFGSHPGPYLQQPPQRMRMSHHGGWQSNEPGTPAEPPYMGGSASFSDLAGMHSGTPAGQEPLIAAHYSSALPVLPMAGFGPPSGLDPSAYQAPYPPALGQAVPSSMAFAPASAAQDVQSAAPYGQHAGPYGHPATVGRMESGPSSAAPPSTVAEAGRRARADTDASSLSAAPAPTTNGLNLDAGRTGSRKRTRSDEDAAESLANMASLLSSPHAGGDQ